MFTVELRFAELRALAERVNAFYSKQTLIHLIEINSRYKIDVDGMEAEELLIKFGDCFHVDFKAFRLEEYFMNESKAGDPFRLLGLLVGTFFSLLAWVTIQAIRLANHRVDNNLQSCLEAIGRKLSWPRSISKQLTVGDLIASAAVGRFVERREVQFKLT